MQPMGWTLQFLHPTPKKTSWMKSCSTSFQLSLDGMKLQESPYLMEEITKQRTARDTSVHSVQDSTIKAGIKHMLG